MKEGQESAYRDSHAEGEPRRTVAIKELIAAGEVRQNVNDLDYQAARDLLVFLIKNPDIESIDCGGIFARSGFEQDALIDVLKMRGITLKHYKGVGIHFLRAGIQVDFSK